MPKTVFERWQQTENRAKTLIIGQDVSDLAADCIAIVRGVGNGHFPSGELWDALAVRIEATDGGNVDAR